MTMVVGRFARLKSAQCALADLVMSGYPLSSISVLVHDATNERDEPDVVDRGALAQAIDRAAMGGDRASASPGVETGISTTPRSAAAVAMTLTCAGLKPPAARFFADAICKRATLVAVHCREPYIRDARDILDLHADDVENAQDKAAPVKITEFR